MQFLEGTVQWAYAAVGAARILGSGTVASMIMSRHAAESCQSVDVHG